MHQRNWVRTTFAVIALAGLALTAPLLRALYHNGLATKATSRPFAAEYNNIRTHAKVVAARLRSANTSQAVSAQNEWAVVLRDLEAWANKYRVRLAVRTLRAKGTGTGASPRNIPPMSCKDLSSVGPDGSAAADNSAGHCYLQKRFGQTGRYDCEYLCVPAQVIQQPDIEDSPYPSRGSQP